MFIALKCVQNVWASFAVRPLPAMQICSAPQRDRVNGCSKSPAISEIIGYFAQAGWPGVPMSPAVEGNRVKAEDNAKGEAQVILRVGGVVGQRRAHIVHLQQAYSNVSGEE